MSNASFFDIARNRFRTGLIEVDRKWGWYFALGVFLVVLGVIACGVAVATTLISVMALGWVLLFAGASMVVLSFMTGKWSGFLLTLGAGVLSAIAGLMLLGSPIAGAVAVTLIVGLILMTAGLYRSVASVIMQFPNWGWSLFSGIISFALGAMLLNSWQTTSLWFLGLYIGIDLILHGLSWIMFSSRVHRLAGELRTTDEDRRRAA